MSSVCANTKEEDRIQSVDPRDDDADSSNDIVVTVADLFTASDDEDDDDETRSSSSSSSDGGSSHVVPGAGAGAGAGASAGTRVIGGQLMPSHPSKGPEPLSAAQAATVAALQAKFESLVKAHPLEVGRTASKAGRADGPEKQAIATLVYGEVRFDALALVLHTLRERYGALSKPGGVFYDIGSGTGKPVFGAALLHCWDKVVGIEVVQDLHNAALEMLEVWNASIKPTLPAAAQGTKLELLRGDATKMDWSDADVWFANATMFDAPLMAALCKVADRMRVGAFAITTTEWLVSPKWEVLEYFPLQVNQGLHPTVYIQRKIKA